MYVILVYDCGEKRVGKMLKLCRKYLNWIQNSVFEGEITEVKLKELTLKAEKIMNSDEDSLMRDIKARKVKPSKILNENKIFLINKYNK